MIDREKVIKGLETCYCPSVKCEDCPYRDLPDEMSCNDALCLDALTLLKEQEAVKPEPITLLNEQEAVKPNWYYGGTPFCGNCGYILQKKNGQHVKERLLKCPKCGTVVKWK